MKLFIVGLGTIGEPLARLFLKVQERLGIEEIIIHKNTPELKYRGMLSRFNQFGAKLAVFANRKTEFETLLAGSGFGLFCTFEEALDRADIVVDCTKEKIGRMLKDKYYKNWADSKLGFIAQGSEKGFGKPYAFGINDGALISGADKFIQVVSCNTHQILCLLKTLVFDYGGAENLVKARFYLGRRASDISQIESTVGVEVGSPSHPIYGSHQGEDAARVFETVGFKDLDIHTAADKLNNPFMHVVHFDVTLRDKITLEEVEQRFRRNPLTAVTYWQTNNEVFAAGRDWGHFGRILNQTVVCLPSLQVIGNGHEVCGSLFTPQDGNALLSSVAAALWFIDPAGYKDKVKDNFFKLPFLFDEV